MITLQITFDEVLKGDGKQMNIETDIIRDSLVTEAEEKLSQDLLQSIKRIFERAQKKCPDSITVVEVI